MQSANAITEEELDRFLNEEFEPEGLNYIEEVMADDQGTDEDGLVKRFGGPPGRRRYKSKQKTKSYFKKQKRDLKKTIRETVCKLVIDILPDEDYLKELAKKLTDALIKVIPVGVDIILSLLRKLFEKAIFKVLQWLLGLLEAGVERICDGVDEDTPSPLAPVLA
ncbi:hypothetical protein [Rubritalea tangerina]|uniref:Uncharacterized protein n=2 Tax=Rubritalea tangerina TaxID=430798 RepID=A0ABW4ZE23_9BACT